MTWPCSDEVSGPASSKTLRTVDVCQKDYQQIMLQAHITLSFSAIERSIVKSSKLRSAEVLFALLRLFHTVLATDPGYTRVIDAIV